MVESWFRQRLRIDMQDKPEKWQARTLFLVCRHRCCPISKARWLGYGKGLRP